ncbi:hypothetical protein JWZ98_14615 [Methylomonas sp. EFPC1]|uniref:hypothetical protein n=1 Tax=Methylomonas sp. EFPC1 TaxID=2812647 RepID=UPI001967E8FA|nr:hypothetical protein [Methylomonas sp. EFPC1]QSA99911.1 hypothetical protein JWZ98_14615 [Methylomonas sp. EFPC1]
MRDGELEESLLSVLGNKGGKDLIQEAAEFSLDALLDDGVVKDIPIVGSVAKLYSVAVGAQGYVFAKKIRKFLAELSSIPQQQREDFALKLEEDKKLRERTVETVLALLDKLDDLQKASLLARAFTGYVRDEFDFSTFQRLATAVDRCLVADLPLLEKMANPISLEGYIGDMLVSAGLATIESIPAIRASGVNKTYGISHLGELFVQVVVKGLPRDD